MSRAALVRLDHPPANAIGPALIRRLAGALAGARAERRPVVLTGSGRFFSAGLDLKGLPRDRESMGAFADAFEDFLRDLFSYPGPTVAAVNGHAVAGGAILAASADFRIGAEGDYRVGVSEVALGVAFPAIAFEIVRAALAAPRTADVLLRGRLTGPAGAVESGLLHELAPAADLLDRAVALAEELGALPQRAYRHTKGSLRAEFLDRARERRAACRELFLDTWFSPESRARRTARLTKA